MNKNEHQIAKIFINGHIYPDATQKRVENILVKDDIVAAVNVAPAAYKDAEIIDLDTLAEGASMYPGFCDSHAHLVESALGFSGGNLRGSNDPDAIIAKVKESLNAYNHPPDYPFFGAGFSLDNYNDWLVENLTALDEVTGDRIVLLVDDLGHNMIVNSAAMGAAQITIDSEVPPGGEAGKDGDQLTGMLREEAMLLAGIPLLPLFPDDLFSEQALAFMQEWASKGYTSIVDLMGAPMGRVLRPQMCQWLERSGKLPLRINYNYTFFNLDDLECEPCMLKTLPKDTDLVRFIGNKLFVDGAYAAGEAWTTWQHADGSYGLHSVGFGDNADYNIGIIIARMEEMGYNCHYHIQGDRALDVTLDALSNVLAKKSEHGEQAELSCVHTLIHLAFPRPDQIERIKSFNGKVVTTVQPAFWDVEEGLQRYYGDRADSSYPIKQLFNANISVGMSTDFAVSPEEVSPPTKIMQIAMTRGGDQHLPLTM